VKVVPFQTRLTKDNALDIVRDFDLVVDGCDNFSTRFLVNDACVFLGKGRTLMGRLLTYDALEMSFHEYKVRRDPKCAVCGDQPTIREVSDLEWSCHFEPREPRAAAVS
jgi:adenylyltransferase/sulfurtransferase